MTLATVQIILASLGLLTGLLIAVFGPGRRWIRWPLAIAAGAGVALSAWPTLWQNGSDAIEQLYQSLLLGAVVVLIALLTMMLLYPSKRTKQREIEQKLNSKPGSTTAPETDTGKRILDEIAVPDEAGKDSININLEQNPNAMIANQDEHAQMHLLGSTRPSLTKETALPEEEPLLIEIANDVSLVDPDTNRSQNPVGSTADVVSLAERREKQSATELDDKLDLSSSDELYQAMRDAEIELDLSDESTWLNEEPELEIETRESINDLMNETSVVDMPVDIEDAEILEIVDDIEAASETTTTALPVPEEIEHDAAVTRISTSESHSRGAANSLQDALNAQRQSISQLNADTETLSDRLSEWGSLTDKNEQTAWAASLRQGQTVQQQQKRLLAENNFRQAAIELIHTQRDVMKQLMNQLGILGAQREEDLKTLTELQENAVTQRRLARQAALLARQAAADKRELMLGLNEERRNHDRTRGAAKRAMGIARDAVDKLAEHEKKLELTEDSFNPETKG